MSLISTKAEINPSGLVRLGRDSVGSIVLGCLRRGHWMELPENTRGERSLGFLRDHPGGGPPTFQRLRNRTGLRGTALFERPQLPPRSTVTGDAAFAPMTPCQIPPRSLERRKIRSLPTRPIKALRKTTGPKGGRLGSTLPPFRAFASAQTSVKSFPFDYPLRK